MDLFRRIRDESVKLCCMKLAQILHVLGPQFIWRRAPKFLDLHYKAHPDCDHVAKFHGDRLRELGDLVAKEIKKHHGQNIRPLGTTVPGGLIMA